MRAILINPEDQTVTEIDIEKGLPAIYAQIGNNCSTFECPFTYPNGDTIYCDEEGLYHENIGGFMYDGWASPIVGRALVIGQNPNTGNSIDAKSHINAIEFDLDFIPKDDKYLERYFSQHN
jgi:hypothetical protein